MKVVTLEQIRAVLPGIDLLSEIEAGFVAYSGGRAVVPPVAELLMQDPPGEVHIKYGYLTGDDYFVIKVASGFYNNPALGLPSFGGLMLLFRRQTGQVCCALADEGVLTNIRTAVAGAVVARALAPREVRRIGVLGTGTQARLQLEYLAPVTSCREATVWGRDPQKIDEYRRDMEAAGFSVAAARQPSDLLSDCDLIVTTTPTTEPLLRHFGEIERGLHITAVGADTAHKRELDASILTRADLVVADSVSQCLERGEIHHAVREGALDPEAVVELGDVFAGRHPGRLDEQQFTVADLTGVAVQDIQIARAVYEGLDRQGL